MVTLSHVELDTIASPSGSIHFGFFGIAFGAFVTSVVVLSTVDIISPKTYAAYIGAAIVTGVASAYFGVRAGIDFSDVRKRLRELKGDPAMPQLPR